MQNFLIIDKRTRLKEDKNSISYVVQRISEELDKKNIKYVTGFFDELSMYTNENNIEIQFNNTPLSNFTHIILRGHRTVHEYQLKYHIAEYSKKNNIILQNSEFILASPFYNKIFQMNLMVQNKIPYIESYYNLSGNYHKNIEVLKKFEFPLIYKHIEGEYKVENKEGENKLKKNIHLVSNIKELEALFINKEDSDKYFIQRFSNSGEDFRSIMINGKLVGVWKRIATENFLTVNKGIYSLIENPPKEFIELSEKTSRLFKADYCAIDIMYKNDKAYVLEINMNPGFKAFETKVIGHEINVPKLMIEQLLTKEVRQIS